MFGSIRLIFMVLIISGIAGAGMYVMKLRADNAILKANQIALEQSITSQKKLLEQQKVDFDAIMVANKQMNILVNNLKEDLQNLSPTERQSQAFLKALKNPEYEFFKRDPITKTMRPTLDYYKLIDIYGLQNATKSKART